MEVDPVRNQRTQSWESWYKDAYGRFDLSPTSIVAKSTFPLYCLFLPCSMLLGCLSGNRKPLPDRAQALQNAAQSQQQQNASAVSSSSSSSGGDPTAVSLLSLDQRADATRQNQNFGTQDRRGERRLGSSPLIPSAVHLDAPSMAPSSPPPNSNEYLAVDGVNTDIVGWKYVRNDGNGTSDDSGTELSSGAEAEYYEARTSVSPQGIATQPTARPASSSPLQTIDEKRRAVAFGSLDSSGNNYRVAQGSGSPNFNRPMTAAYQYAAASSSSSLPKSQSLDSLSSNKSKQQ